MVNDIYDYDAAADVCFVFDMGRYLWKLKEVYVSKIHNP